jgi:hypothetical protein
VTLVESVLLGLLLACQVAAAGVALYYARRAAAARRRVDAALHAMRHGWKP